MGMIRTLLAIAVVLSHTGALYSFVVPYIAVEMFYVASGYLIAYSFMNNVHYQANWKAFYFNRALRIYPVYLVVLMIAGAGFILMPAIFARPALLDADLPGSAKAFLLLSNFTLLFQDWCYLLGLNDGHLVFMPNYWLSQPQLSTFFPVPQAWTLGVELSFYLLAPLLLRDNRILLPAFVVAALLKGYAIRSFGGGDPWLYRVFPLELSLFLLGALSQRFLSPLHKLMTRSVPKADIAIATVAIAAVILFRTTPAGFLIIHPAWEGIECCVVFALALPALFSFQQRFAIDRAIGELSYPIYIAHFLAISFGSYFLGAYGATHPQTSSLAITSLSVLLAVALHIFIAMPSEALRKRIRTGDTPVKQ